MTSSPLDHVMLTWQSCYFCFKCCEWAYVKGDGDKIWRFVVPPPWLRRRGRLRTRPFPILIPRRNWALQVKLS